MRHLMLFTILALASLCRAQTIDPVARQIRHTVGTTKHTIGDVDNTGVFEARTKFEFWGEDSLDISMPGVSGDMTIDSGRVTIPWGQNKNIEFVQDGDFLRWKLHFDKKPPFSSYSFALGPTWNQYEYLYQTPFPSPVDFIGPDGKTWVRQATLPNDPAINHQRRKAMDGGWAVVHKTKRDNKYKIGVALYIMRPKMVDNTGNVTWGTVDITGDTYTVSFPPNVWAQADYPIVINDTFGETDPSGYSNAQLSVDWWIADYAAPSGGDGTGDSLEVYCYETVGGRVEYTCGLYNDDANPITLVANGTTAAVNIPQTTAAWETFTFGTPPSVTNATTYVLAMHLGGNGRFHYISEVPGTRGLNDNGEAYSSGAMPTNFNVNTTDYNRKIAIYCIYTPTGGATGAQVIITH